MLPGLKKRVLNFHDVLMYVAIARKHLRLMVLLMCLCWLAGLVYYVYARPIFYSRSLVKVDAVERQVSAEKEFGEGYRLGSIVNELTAPHILERTAAKLGIRADYRTILKDYVKKIQAKQNSEKNIELEVWPYSLDWAKRWSETTVAEYLQYRRERRMNESRQRQENYLRDRKEQLELLEINREKQMKTRSELDTERAIIEFEELRTLHSDLVDVGRQLDEIGQVRIQVLNPEFSPIEKLSRITAVTDRPIPLGATATAPGNGGSKPEGTTVQVVTPTLAKPSPVWQELEKELNTLKLQGEELAQTYLPGHAKMVALQEELDAVNLKLNGELRTALDRLDTYHRILLDRQKSLNEKLPEFEKRLARYNSVRQQEEIVKDSMVAWQNLYTRLEKDHQTELYALDRDRVSITFSEVLQVNDMPVSPNRFSLLIYTTILGLMLALGIPFLLEYLDHTLSNLEQVESAFRLRGLGIVPKMESDEASTGLLNHDEWKETNVLENFRVIRTNLLSMGSLSKPPHVLMVTSAMPKEGKTVVSSNLALSFAYTGAKTLLLDTDLRRGRLHRLFGYRKQPGLSGVLLGQVTLDEAIRPTHHENLYVLSTGQHVETGTELLGGRRFKDIMVELRQRFDRIVMDTPPVLGLSETSVLQNDVDGVLFVIWSGHTPIKGVRAAVEMLQANGANFYGFVLNRLDLSSSANYYQYYYYSHDYYYHYSPRALENA